MSRVRRQSSKMGTHANPSKIDWLSYWRCDDWVQKALDFQAPIRDAGWSFARHLGGYTHLTCLDLLAKPKEGYAEVGHYVNGQCCKKVLGNEVVGCVRRRKGQTTAFLTTHIAGKCPYMEYKERREIDVSL